MLTYRRKPYEHQDAALAFCDHRQFYALLMQQGTGKSFVFNNDAARRWERKEISGAAIFAPNGVHTNWVRREIPKDIPDEVPWRAAAYYADANLKQRQLLEHLITPTEAGSRPPLRFLTMNYEALNTEEGFIYARKFCGLMANRGRGLMMGLDESQRTKNPGAKRTKAIARLRPSAKVRAIMTGTPILGKPWDAFSQFGFLDDSICGQPSYTTFRAEYAELMPPDSGIMRHVVARLMAKTRQMFGDSEAGKAKAADYIRKYGPQIVKRDPVTNKKMWRNLEQLEQLLAPHSFRVLKEDCLDLPEKIFSQIWFKMTGKQRSIYERARDEFILTLANGEESAMSRLASLTKLSQIVSGYFIVPGTKDVVERIMPLEKNPKIELFMDSLEDAIEERGEQVIVWARFQVELQDLATMFRKKKWSFSEYHGQIGSKTARQDAIDDFEEGRKQIFLSEQASGGTGLTLIAPNSIAETMSMFYYSNTYALEDRLQSLERAHRIGQEKHLNCCDVLCEDSCDEMIMSALDDKIEVADIVTGDTRRAEAMLN